MIYPPDEAVNRGRRYQAINLRVLARNLVVTSSALIYTAWAFSLARHTGLDEATFATAMAGREIPVHHVATLDGPTLTIVPQRVVLDPTATLSQAVKTEHESF